MDDSDEGTLDTACDPGKASSQMQRFDPSRDSKTTEIEIEKSTQNGVAHLAAKLRSKEITFHQAYFGYVHHMHAA